MLRRLLGCIAIALALSGSAAHAQSTCPTIVYGAVLTAGQWNQCFANKQDALGYTPVNQAGDTMTGRLATAASTTFKAGFYIAPGVAPTSPVNGDIWVTSSGMYVRISGTTVGPLTATGSAVPSVVQGDLLYGSGVSTLATLPKNTTATRYLSNTGTGNNPAWAQVNLANGVTGSLPIANIANGTQDTVLGYFSSTAISASGVPNCTGALTYSASTHGFGCNASGGVFAFGTPTANQIAQWTNANTIQGVSLASILTTGATLQASPASPTGTTSTTGVMMGLGASCHITTVYSSRIKVDIFGVLNENSGAISTLKLYYGTGTAPANGAATTGTQVAALVSVNGSGTTGVSAPVANGAVITGLTPGTAYWIDVNLATSTGAQTASLSNPSCNAMEF